MKTFLLPLAAVALLIGCSFSVPDAEPRESSSSVTQAQNKTVVLSGSIKLSGANPSFFVGDSNARTALPEEPAASSLTFIVTAQSGSTEINITTSDSPNGCITVDSGTGTINYSINLSSGSWNLSACAKDSSGNTILATKQNVTANLSESAAISPLVLNYVSSSSSELGKIQLSISAAADSGIHSIAVTGDLSATNNSNSWNWTINNVVPGSYNVNFVFYSSNDCTGDILYRIKEVVNVYSNLTTTKFEAYPAGYVSSGNISVTKALVQSAELVTIYVNSSGNDTGTGSYFSPVKTLARGIEIVNNSSAPSTSTFEVIVQNDVSLGHDVTLNSGRKASITSENPSSAATVSGGSSHNSLTIAGEAEVSNLNFNGLGGINVYGYGLSPKLKINDSTVENGVSSAGGGGFFVGGGAELVSEQGLVIKNCSAETPNSSGGGIYSSGTVSLTGVQILGCTATVGSSIYNNTTGSLALSGNTSINGTIFLYSPDNPLELESTFTTTGTITVALNVDPSHFTFGDLAIEATETQVAYFTTPTDSTYSLVYSTTANGAVMSLSDEDAIIYVGGAGADDDTGEGTILSPFATLYKAVEVAKTRYITIPDNYIIKVQDAITESQDIEVEAVPGLTIVGKVSEGSTDTIQVNGGGKSITFSCNTTLKNLEFKSFAASSTTSGPVTIASSVEVEAEYVTVTECTNTNGRGGGIYNEGTLTLTNCTVSECEATYSTADTNSGRGGGIFSAADSSLTLDGTTVKKNNAATGGGFYIESTVTMTDSTVQENTADSTIGGMGGGIYISATGNLTMSGNSLVTQNTAGSSTNTNGAYGGGIMCSGSMTMNGGTISSNNARATGTSFSYGGGISLYKFGSTLGSFTMSGGTISKNSADFGGGISTQGIDLTLSGGTIGGSTYVNGNTSKKFGGGLYVGALTSGGSITKPTCAINGCNIKYNTSNESGGGVFAEGCTMTLSSGSVSNNKVYSDAATYISGGGVYIKEGSLTISGTAEISNNMVSAGSGTLDVCGGGLFIYENGIVTMEGGSIDANVVSAPSVAAKGGGVYIYSTGKMTLSGGTIISNTASDTSSSSAPLLGAMGGGFYIFTSGELTMTGGSINSNSASTTNNNCIGGGIYSFGKVTLTGGELKSNKCLGSSGLSGMGGGIFVTPLSPTVICSFTLNTAATITGNSALYGPNRYINTGTYYNSSTSTLSSALVD